MKTYLIFGGTGSLGQKLLERLTTAGDRVCVYSRDESKHWTIRNNFANDPRGKLIEFFVGDIRDPGRVKDVINRTRPDVTIIAAALKHVDTCELSPLESIKTNIDGTQNVCDALMTLQDDRDKSVCFVSTDKACSPINVYGMCKAISERIVTNQPRQQNLRYVCVRYGNVLESRGSIIPLFRYQAENKDMLTVTDPSMTRFLMTLNDSVDLIMHAVQHGKHGDTWVPRIKAMRIGDLAQIFSERYHKPVKIVGLRPGEKMHESLINYAESVRTYSSGLHYVIASSLSSGNEKMFEYTSADDVLTREALEEHLVRLGIMDSTLDSFKGKEIEEIRKS